MKKTLLFLAVIMLSLSATGQGIIWHDSTNQHRAICPDASGTWSTNTSLGFGTYAWRWYKMTPTYHQVLTTYAVVSANSTLSVADTTGSLTDTGTYVVEWGTISASSGLFSFVGRDTGWLYVPAPISAGTIVGPDTIC